MRSQWRRVDAIPFEPANKYMATLHEGGSGGHTVILKGAPEVVLGFCDTGPGGEELDAKLVTAMIDQWAASGMRVIAIALRNQEQPIAKLSPEELGHAKLIGLAGMIDPPRPETIPAILACHRAGMAVKMITGDHPQTALAIGIEIGLAETGDTVVVGSDIAVMSRTELEASVFTANVFARVEPEHKLHLVRTLQSRGEVVAMTGDGVNDSPALKQADIGIAMGITGTAAAREAANVILVDDNFATIASAVEEGRCCYDNLIKALTFLLPTNLGQALIVVVGVLAFPVVGGVPVTPILPLQVLWINLVTGVTLALPLAFEVPEPELMNRRPRPRRKPMLTRELALRTIIVGTLIVVGGVGLFLYDYYGAFVMPIQEYLDPAIAKAQTMTATTVVLFQVFYLMQSRSLETSIFHQLFSNMTVYTGTAATLLMQAGWVHLPPFNALFHSAPLTLKDWLISAAVAATVVPVVALHKYLHRRRMQKAALIRKRARLAQRDRRDEGDD
jgi:magnesium-transporting ATPase (P-type)